MGLDGTLLLTGFEPFGGDARNPSAELAQRFHGERIGGLLVVSECLPCVFAAAPQALEAAVARCRPRLVLAMGQAAGRAELSLERVAINLIDAHIPDNQGARPVDEPVQPGGPAAYFSTLPLKAMVAASCAAGVPAGLSHSAGTFVCNQVFYSMQHRFDGQAMPAGFMHLPLLPEQTTSGPGRPSMSLETMALGLRAALAAAAALLRYPACDAAGSADRPR